MSLTYAEEFLYKIKNNLINFNFLTKQYNSEDIASSNLSYINTNNAKIFKLIINNDVYAIKASLYFVNENINEYLFLKNINKELKHSVKIYDFFLLNNYIVYLMEYIENMLSPRKLLIDTFKKCVICVNELHENNIVHLDIHKNNFIFDSKHNIMKIIDFELAKMNDAEFSIVNMFGNVYKYPPIIHNKINKVNKQFDIFSLGVMFYQMVYYMNPFHSKHSHENMIIYYDDKNFERYNILLKYIFNNYNNIDTNNILDFINKNYES